MSTSIEMPEKAMHQWIKNASIPCAESLGYRLVEDHPLFSEQNCLGHLLQT